MALWIGLALIYGCVCWYGGFLFGRMVARNDLPEVIFTPTDWQLPGQRSFYDQDEERWTD